MQRVSVVLPLSFLLLAGLAVPAGAVITPMGPQEMLLDPIAGRLYTYLAYDNRILAMDVASGLLVSIITEVGILGDRYEGTGIRTIALDEQAGRLFAISSAERGPDGQSWTLYVIDTTQGTIVQKLSMGVSPSPSHSQLLTDPVHSKLYAVGETDTLVYDTISLADLGTLPGGRWALIDRESDKLYLVDDEGLAVINTADDTILAEAPRPQGFPFGMAVDPLRDRFYLALEGAIHVLDTATQQWLDPLPNVPSIIFALAVDPGDGELYIAGREEGGDMMNFYVFVLSPDTGEHKTTITFQEPPAPEGYECLGYEWVNMGRWTLAPDGGTIYGSGNTMSRCRPEAHLAFVLDTEAETVVEWLPRLPTLPDTGGQLASGGWLALAGFGLSLSGILVYCLQSRPAKSSYH